MKTQKMITQIAAFGLMASMAEGEVFRYHQGGDWSKASNGAADPIGWGLNPNNTGEIGSLPGAADQARINWGGNTVVVSTTVPTVNKVMIGVDENGTVDVISGGVLTASGENGDVLVGNNNEKVTDANLIVRDGGSVDVGRILWSSHNLSTGNILIENGGTVTVASHLWLGVTKPSTITIHGTLTQTGGILGLGTLNAVDASGGTATLDVLDGGLLELNNIHAGGTSIQEGSVLNVGGTGVVTIPGDHVDVINSYIDNNRISGNGVLGRGALVVDLDTNPGFTTITAVPVVEPEDVPIVVSSVTFDQNSEDISLTWNSVDGELFIIRYGIDLINWNGELEDQYEADPGITTTFTVNRSQLLGATAEKTVFFQVERVVEE